MSKKITEGDHCPTGGTILWVFIVLIVEICALILLVVYFIGK